MKIRYLGTAAAERTPAMFCNCDVCRRAAALGGKNIQTQTQSLIDDKLLIDFSGDTDKPEVYRLIEQLKAALPSVVYLGNYEEI